MFCVFSALDELDVRRQLLAEHLEERGVGRWVSQRSSLDPITAGAAAGKHHTSRPRSILQTLTNLLGDTAKFVRFETRSENQGAVEDVQVILESLRQHVWLIDEYADMLSAARADDLRQPELTRHGQSLGLAARSPSNSSSEISPSP